VGGRDKDEDLEDGGEGVTELNQKNLFSVGRVWRKRGKAIT